jgi:NAD(P)-dependent dehydrogenase (short-subunit alcohol dehydrogenase family)
VLSVLVPDRERALTTARKTDGLGLADQVILVTGGARGLGRAHDLALARRGASVVIVDRLEAGDLLAEIRDSDGEASSARVDLATPTAGEEAVRAALDAFGDLHGVVNNAGVVRDRMSFNLSVADWDLVLAVNLSASFFVSRAAAEYWRQTSHPGVIVNTTSESGLFGNAGQANYSAAKAGVAAMTVTMATELDRDGIRVNAIAPRARTPMSLEAFGELPRDPDFDVFGAEHVSEVVSWLVSDAAAGVTGQVLVVHGTAVELMRTWSTERRVERHGSWADDELLSLRDRLFPLGDARRLAAPVGDLFVSSDEPKEE